MNFDSLEYFSVLARERSFTRAAESLHITQQSLSSHIAGLEKELNCQLVVRRIPLELTYAGQTFLSYAEELRRGAAPDAARHAAGILRHFGKSEGGAARRDRLYPRAGRHAAPDRVVPTEVSER